MCSDVICSCMFGAMEDAVEGLALALQEYARVHHLMQAGCTLLGWFRKTWPGLALRSLVQGESQQTRRVIMQGHTHTYNLEALSLHCSFSEDFKRLLGTFRFSKSDMAAMRHCSELW